MAPTLSEITDVESCYPAMEGGSINNTDPTYFCQRFPYGSTNFVERSVEVEVADENAYAAFVLLYRMDQPEVYRLDPDVERHFERDLSIVGLSGDKRRDALTKKILTIFSSCKVVGISISVENIDQYYQ